MQWSIPRLIRDELSWLCSINNIPNAILHKIPGHFWWRVLTDDCSATVVCFMFPFQRILWSYETLRAKLNKMETNKPFKLMKTCFRETSNYPELRRSKGWGCMPGLLRIFLISLLYVLASRSKASTFNATSLTDIFLPPLPPSASSSSFRPAQINSTSI